MATTTKPRKSRAKKELAPPEEKSIRLDLGAGIRPLEGFEGVDIKPGPGIVHVVDLFQSGWPFEDNSVDEIYSAHFVEHLPHYRPEYNGVDGWWIFFNEVYRICKPNAKVTFAHPYAKNDRAFWDPTHTRYIHETTWYYLNKAWRETQGLGHYDAICDFEIIVIQGTGVADDIAARNHEHQSYAREHYWNVIPDLVVELKALKPE